MKFFVKLREDWICPGSVFIESFALLEDSGFASIKIQQEKEIPRQQRTSKVISSSPALHFISLLPLSQSLLAAVSNLHCLHSVTFDPLTLKSTMVFNIKMPEKPQQGAKKRPSAPRRNKPARKASTRKEISDAELDQQLDAMMWGGTDIDDIITGADHQTSASTFASRRDSASTYASSRRASEN